MMKAYSPLFLVLLAFSLLSIERIGYAEIFTLNRGRALYCEPKISRNGKYVAYSSHTPGLPPTATWEILPQYLNSSALYTPSRFRIYEPIAEDHHPERITTGAVGVNSNGLGYWFNTSGLPSHTSRYWIRSSFGLGPTAELFGWGSEVSYSAFDANDFDEMVGMGHTSGTLAGFAAIFNNSGLSRRLPVPEGIRGDSVGFSINNSGIIGGHMVFVMVRDGVLRASPHAAVWVPAAPLLPKAAHYNALPLDLNPLSAPNFEVLGSSINAVGPSTNPWIGGSIMVRRTRRSFETEQSFGFARHGLGTDFQFTVLQGTACRLLDGTNPLLGSNPICINSAVTGINDQYAVGQATYELTTGGQVTIPFFVPLPLLGEGLYDLNRHIPQPSSWNHLMAITGLSENNIVVGMGYFDEDMSESHSNWRGFAIQL